MAWALNPTREWLVTPATLRATIAPCGSSLQITDMFLAEMGFAFLLWSRAEYLPVPQTLVSRGEG